jgi:hypothetical protein
MSAGAVRLFRLFIASYAPLALILAIQRSSGIWPPWDRPAFWVFAAIIRLAPQTARGSGED